MTHELPWWKQINRYQWIVLLVAWLGWVFDIMDTALFNFAKRPMLTEIMGASAYTSRGANVEGFIQTIFLLGWAAGGLIFGILADRWGRIRTLALTVLLYCLFTGLTALCVNYEQVLIARFLTALGIGGEWAAGAALVAEVFPSHIRVRAAGYLQTAAAFGPWLASFINWELSSKSWRWLFVVGIFPAFITLIARVFLREPDKWKAAKKENRPLVNFWKKPIWRTRAIWGCLLGVAGIVAAQNLSFWLPNMVKEFSKTYTNPEIAQRTSCATYVLHIGTLLGVLIFPILCEKFGRKLSFRTFLILSPLLIVSSLPFIHTYSQLVLAMPICAFFTIGLSSGFAIYFPELFPSSIRATGAGFCYNTGRIFSAPFPLLTGMLITSRGGSPIFGVTFFAFVTILGLVALFFLPETKDKGLPEEL